MPSHKSIRNRKASRDMSREASFLSATQLGRHACTTSSIPHTIRIRLHVADRPHVQREALRLHHDTPDSATNGYGD